MRARLTLVAALVLAAAGCADGGGAADGGAPADADAGAAGPDARAAAPDGSADPGGPDITYAPHTVLEIPTEVDVDGAPDLADPHVVKVGGTWYLYASQSKRDLHVWLSEDLAAWRDGGVVWAPTPGTWNAEGQVWAPHVEPTPDGWFLYYTAGQRIGVARGDGPLGPFVDVYDRELVGGGHGGVGDGVFEHRDPAAQPPALDPLDFEEYAIDAFVLRAGDGRRVLYFCAYTPLSVIHAVPLLDWTVLADEPPRPVLTPEPTTWERLVNEGAWVEEHAGRFHLVYSGAAANTADYGLGVAVAADPFGPFTKRADNPLLHTNAAAGFYGPGHHGIADGAFGDRLLFYHTKVSPALGFDRRVRYVPVSFDAAGDLRLDVPQP